MATQTLVTLSKEYSSDQMSKLQSILQRHVAIAEEQLKECSYREGKRQAVYVTEPAHAKSYSEANTVKCIIWDYTLSEDKQSAVVRYGASIFNKYDKIRDCDESSRYDNSSQHAIVDHKDVASQCSTRSSRSSTPSVFKKKHVFSTAMARYTNWPVTFTVHFRDMTKSVPVVNIEVKMLEDGTEVSESVEDVEQRPVPRDEQVMMQIKRKMADGAKRGGGCCARKSMKEQN